MDLRSYVRFLRGSWELVAVFTLIGITVAMGFVVNNTKICRHFRALPDYARI